MKSNTITKLAKLFLALLFIATTVITGSVITKQKTNAAETYCKEGFFQYADNQLKIYSPADDDFTNIGDPYSNGNAAETGVINASGCNFTLLREPSFSGAVSKPRRLSAVGGRAPPAAPFAVF
ncbi:MAG: hypothetical protein KBF89_08450 [Acidimicrobiia bacterium]|nr:hypothetical protein [Acidimicrobiia bacterium]